MTTDAAIADAARVHERIGNLWEQARACGDRRRANRWQALGVIAYARWMALRERQQKEETRMREETHHV